MFVRKLVSRAMQFTKFLVKSSPLAVAGFAFAQDPEELEGMKQNTLNDIKQKQGLMQSIDNVKTNFKGIKEKGIESADLILPKLISLKQNVGEKIKQYDFDGKVVGPLNVKLSNICLKLMTCNAALRELPQYIDNSFVVDHLAGIAARVEVSPDEYNAF